MGWLKQIFSRRRRYDEIAESIRDHLEEKIEDLMEDGLSREEAARKAHREFGNTTLIEERSREVWQWPRLETLFRDLRFGVRMLLKNKSFTAVAILSLSLGIGANTAIFQLIDALRLRMLPVKAPQELAEVRLADTKGVAGGGSSDRLNPTVTNRIWEQFRERQQAFSSVSAWSRGSVNLAPGGEIRYARMLWVSGDFFHTLGVQSALGRVFTTTDDQRGCGAAGLVISHTFWQREFGADANIIGRKLTLAERQFEIIGVTPASFFGMEVGRSFDLAAPLCAVPLVQGNDRALSGSYWWLTVTGRLKPGWSMEQATAHTQAISPGVFEASLPPKYPPAYIKDYMASRLNAIPAGERVYEAREKYEQSLLLLLAIAGSVLLVACANLTNLLLARASAREREIAVRQALGASRGQIIRQLLVESLLLAAAGAALGAGLAQALSRFLVAFLSTSDNQIFLNLSPDWRVLGFAAGLAVLTCLTFGLAPAIRVTRVEPGAVMKTGGRGLTASRERFSLRRALAVAQVALSLALVAGAILFSRSLVKLLTVDTGFRQESVLTAEVFFQRLNLPPDRFPAFKEDLLDRLRAIPGVDSAALTYEIPLRSGANANVWMDGADARKGMKSNLGRVGPDYFKTMQIPLLAGREFDARDKVGAPNMAIVNETFARKFLNQASPVGQRFWIEGLFGAPETRYEIVGLARDTKQVNLREEFLPIAYVAASQDLHSPPGGPVLIRSRLPQTEIVAAVKRVLHEINPAITVSFQSFKPMIEATILRERLMATLSGFFGLLALLLACIGLYGILTYAVASRTNEIGIRMALGAQARDVRWLILREALALVIAGVALGLPMIFAGARLAATLLFGLTPTDPVSLISAALLMLAVALVAGYLPSRRATRVDPMATMRCE